MQLVRQLGLDQPFFVQYGHFLWAALHGHFGISYRLAQPVSGCSSNGCRRRWNWR